MFFIVCDLKGKKTVTTWRFEKQFVNKLSLLRIILQRKGKTGVLCLFSSSQLETSSGYISSQPGSMDSSYVCRGLMLSFLIFKII